MQAICMTLLSCPLIFYGAAPHHTRAEVLLPISIVILMVIYFGTVSVLTSHVVAISAAQPYPLDVLIGVE